MKIKLFFIFLLLSSSLFSSVISNDQRDLGKKIFKQKNCVMCHKLDTSINAPSIKKMGKVYSGKERKLYNFLIGKRKPLINTNKSNIMKGQLSRIRSLNNKKIKAIARYIVTIDDREF